MQSSRENHAFESRDLTPNLLLTVAPPKHRSNHLAQYSSLYHLTPTYFSAILAVISASLYVLPIRLFAIVQNIREIRITISLFMPFPL